MRTQLVRLAAVLAAAPVVAVAFTIISRNNDISVTAQVSTAGPNPVITDIADDAGRVRVFKDVDDFMKQAAKLNVINGAQTVAYTFTNQTALEPALFTGDIVKRTRSQVASYQKNVLSATATATALGTAIGLLPAVTPGEIAYKAEKQAQKDAVDALVTYLTAEIARLTALLPPA